MTATSYQRVLLKLSGEAFSGKTRFGIDRHTVSLIADQIKQVAETGTGIAVVVVTGRPAGWAVVHSPLNDLDRAASLRLGTLRWDLGGRREL